MGETVEDGPAALLGRRSRTARRPRSCDYPVIGDFFFVARGRQVFMGIRAARSDAGRRTGALDPAGRRRQLPGTFAVAKQSSLFEQGLTAGRTIDVEITGPDLRKLVALGGQVLGQVRCRLMPDSPGPPRAQPGPVQPRTARRAQAGPGRRDGRQQRRAWATPSTPWSTAPTPRDYYLDGDKIDLTIMGEAALRRHARRTFVPCPIATPTGELVPLAALADVSA